MDPIVDTEVVMDIRCKHCDKWFTKTLENQGEVIPGCGVFMETCTQCGKTSAYSVSKVTFRTIEIEL